MKTIVVLSTYPVYPRKHGGQMRVFHLYNRIGLHHRVAIVSFNLSDPFPVYQRTWGNVTEISVRATPEHRRRLQQIQAQASIPAEDMLMPVFSRLTPEYERIAQAHMEAADVLVAAQPYLFHLLEPFAGRKKLIYDAQNVEYLLKKEMIPASAVSDALLEQTFLAEKRACELSDAIFVCSEEDAERMTALYRVTPDKMVPVPNGVDLEENPFVDLQTKLRMKQNMGLHRPVAVFVGSGHPPNVQAVRQLALFARELPDVLFMIVGGVCAAAGLYGGQHPPNVIPVGLAEDDLKRLVFAVSDMAVNPVAGGSGTNLKNADYMANGVPVISTPEGARGYRLLSGRDWIVAELPEFPHRIRVLSQDPFLRDSLSRHGRARMEESYSWEAISRGVLTMLQGW